MKGMQKISRGKGFEGVLKYAFERESRFDPPGILIGGNMSGMNIEELTREFGRAHSLRPDIEKPVWHNSLRLPEGDKLSHDTWYQIANDYVAQMGFSPASPYTVIMHDDPKGQHIHIIASRVGFDKSLYLGRNENLISTRIIQSLEPKFGLTITKGLEYDENNRIVNRAEKLRPRKVEVDKAIRTGEPIPRVVLQELVEKAMKGKPTSVVFCERLEAQGVVVIPNIASTGTLNGFTFELDNLSFSGSKLGDKFKWSSLKKAGVSYDADRDFTELAKRRSEASSQSDQAYQREPESLDRNNESLESVTSIDSGVSAGIEPVAEPDTGVIISIESAVEPAIDRDAASIPVAHESVGVDAVAVSAGVDSNTSASDVGYQGRVADEYATADVLGKQYATVANGVGQSVVDSVRSDQVRVSGNGAGTANIDGRNYEDDARRNGEVIDANVGFVDQENRFAGHGSEQAGQGATGQRSEQGEAATIGQDSDTESGKREAKGVGTGEAIGAVGVDCGTGNSIGFGNKRSGVDWNERFKQNQQRQDALQLMWNKAIQEEQVHASDSKSVSPIPFLSRVATRLKESVAALAFA